MSLAALVEEAVARAAQVVAEKSPDLARRRAGAHRRTAVGVGAVKYADLSNDRIKDYVFDWNRMLSFEGNTAPYLMYAHARIRSILRKAAEAGTRRRRAIALEAPAGARPRPRARRSSRAPSTAPPRPATRTASARSSTTSRAPSRRSTRRCPVLKAEGPTRASRLALCDLTARTLALGLDLLGIGAPDQM